MLNVFYGCARKHRPFIPQVAVTTNDIDVRYCCNITCDVRDLIDKQKDWLITNFDGLIFTPPCNYYSRANWRRNTSKVALETKDILPSVLNFVHIQGMPFLVENVQNAPVFKDWYPYTQFTLGGHTFWSNVVDRSDFIGYECPKQNKQFVNRNKRDGNDVVNHVICIFLQKLYLDSIRCFSNYE